MAKQIFKDRELDDETGLSRSTRHRLRLLGLFPKPISLGPRSKGYLRHLQRGNQFARGIDFHGELTARQIADALRQAFGPGRYSGQSLWPAGDHFPFQPLLRNGGLGQGGGRDSCSCSGRLCQELTSFNRHSWKLSLYPMQFGFKPPDSSVMARLDGPRKPPERHSGQGAPALWAEGFQRPEATLVRHFSAVLDPVAQIDKG